MSPVLGDLDLLQRAGESFGHVVAVVVVLLVLFLGIAAAQSRRDP